MSKRTGKPGSNSTTNTVKATLEQQGVDTGKYLSLRIEKGDLPEGSEVIFMVKDKYGATHPINLNGMSEVKAFAEKSRFHDQVMADGHIFNPFVHRRFIAAHFTRLIKEYGCAGVENGVSHLHHWDYAIDLLRKEVRTLRNLEKHDQSCFQERSKFFTLDRCGWILADYTSAVCEFIDRRASESSSDRIHIDHMPILKKNIRPMKHRFVVLAAHAKACRTYDELDKLLSEFDWVQLPKELRLPYCFTNPFVEAGAYFTLKHHMMFEGKTMYGLNQQRSLKMLRDYKGSYLDLYRQLM